MYCLSAFSWYDWSIGISCSIFSFSFFFWNIFNSDWEKFRSNNAFSCQTVTDVQGVGSFLLFRKVFYFHLNTDEAFTTFTVALQVSTFYCQWFFFLLKYLPFRNSGTSEISTSETINLFFGQQMHKRHSRKCDFIANIDLVFISILRILPSMWIWFKAFIHTKSGELKAICLKLSSLLFALQRRTNVHI